MNNIVKSFGGTLALDNVSFKVGQGDIVALLGENGAGKSTLIKILAGVYSMDSGEILYDGKTIEHVNEDTPISFIHQDLGLINWMTVAENIAFTLGFPKKKGVFIDWKALKQNAVKALEVLGVEIDPDERIMNLSRAEQSLVAISRAINKDAKIVFLDEPTASLPASDVEKLFLVLKKLQKDGVSIVLVSHRLDEIFSICDHACVLRDGALVSSTKVSELDERTLVKLIVGQEKEKIHKPTRTIFGESILKIDSLVINEIGPVNFELSKGEVLALSGLRGAGQEEIARVLFGCKKFTSGNIYLNGVSISPQSPEHAISLGISLLARDRLNESICLNMLVTENMYINPNNHGFFYKYSVKNEKNNALEQIKKYDIRPQKPMIEISALSGGNQQKIVLSRWLDIATPIIILEDPTQGIDIGARIEIYKYIENIAKDGYAVIVVSTDYEEIISISHRALVFSRGKIVTELMDDTLRLDNLLYYSSAYEDKEA